MKTIKLTKGEEAIVDKEYYNFLMQWKWCCASGYAARASRKSDNLKKRKLIWMHRVILNRKLGHDKFQDTDHINGNKLDNFIDNLRPASRSQNNWNYKLGRGYSRFKGVYLIKKTKKWAATIGFNSEKIYLGTFENEEDAARSYNEAATKHFGEFAHINIIPCKD